MLVTVGQIGAPHGVRGNFKVRSFTQEPVDLFSYSSLLLSRKDAESISEPSEIPEFDLHKVSISSQAMIASSPSIENRDQAASLTKYFLLMPTSQLPKLSSDEYYWADLMGMHVVNKQGVSFGVICELQTSGPNILMLVREQEGSEIIYIPFELDLYVVDVNRADKVVTVDWQKDYS